MSQRGKWFIFGASTAGWHAMRMLDEWCDVEAFIDNDPVKTGTLFHDRPVFGLDAFIDAYGTELPIAIASSSHVAIYEQLRLRGLRNVFDWYAENGSRINDGNDSLVSSLSPLIYLVAQPKSASSYLFSMLPTKLGVSAKPCTAGGSWPDFNLNYRLVQAGVKRRQILSHHIFPTKINRVILSEFYDRIWVHVRDPRQATLSYLHNIESWLAKKEWGLVACEMLPESYWDWPFDVKLDFHIDNTLETFVNFADRWLSVEEDDTFFPRILFTQYEEFVSDKSSFYSRVADFYSIDPEIFLVDGEIPIEVGPHLYRKGKTDEWRQVMSQKQIERANAKMKFDRFDRFGWRP